MTRGCAEEWRKERDTTVCHQRRIFRELRTSRYAERSEVTQLLEVVLVSGCGLTFASIASSSVQQVDASGLERERI